VDDPKLREYVFCVLKKISFMNEHGDLQIDTIRSKVKPVSRSKNEAKELVDKCVVKKETPQVTAYEMVACWYRKRKG
jgi:DNA phosphorothioation-dependent restriction protein DptG